MGGDWNGYPDAAPRPTPPRSAGPWLRGLATLALVNGLVVLVLGSLITTLGVGMSDAAWPTEPWYLVVNGDVWAQEPARGFLVEHTHRLAAWSIGAVVFALAAVSWGAVPTPAARRFGLVALAALLLAYMALHVEMRAIWNERVARQGLRAPAISLALVAVALAGWLAALGNAARSRGQLVVLLANAALVAVMAQGLLGGFRVFLNQWFGTQLAAVHGAFAQLTFALLVAAWASTRPAWRLDRGDRRELGGVGLALLGVAVLQLGWGVWMRHLASPMAQRLHILTAFAVFGLAMWLAGVILTRPHLRGKIGTYAALFSAVLALQIGLGVEAYLGKFALSGPVAAKPVAERPVTTEAAVVRTAHTVTGAAFLALVTAFAVQVGRAGVVGGVPPVGRRRNPRAAGARADRPVGV